MSFSLLRTQLTLALASLLALTGRAAAELGAPAFRALRYDEDYSPLRRATITWDYTDSVKFVPLSPTGEAWLTLGGESRSRYEYYRHSMWGQGPQDQDGYFLQRFMAHLDAHVSETFRFFVQLKSGIEEGRTGGPRATDEDRLDLNQAFFDVKFPVGSDVSATLRAGRQEMAFGSSRLISFRESPNVRLAFDGVRLTLNQGDRRIDAFAVRPVKTVPGVFDDATDTAQTLWGVYATSPVPGRSGAHVDVYCLGLERETARFAQGVGAERRQSIGTRVWGAANGWDYNVEAVYQFGRFGAGNIQAWTVATDTGYTLGTAPLKPRMGLKADVASGDRSSRQSSLETFNALFPRGAYFNESALIGPANLIDLHPSLELHLSRSVTCSVDGDFFWRQSLGDGLYGPSVNLLRPATAGGGRYIGCQPSVRADWRPERHWSVSATYAHFYAGDFIHRSGSGRDVDYLTSWVTYLF